MIEVKTKSGFACEVDPEVLDDWDFMAALADTGGEDKGKALCAQIYISKHMLGENETRLKDHLKGIYGKASYTRMWEEIGEIFTIAAEKSKEIKK